MKDFISIKKEKIIIFIILLGLSFIKNFTILNIGHFYDLPPFYGFILPFYNPGGNYGPAGVYVEPGFSVGIFIANLILLYLISCLIIKIYSKIKK